jgi:hypothetical protein
MATAGTQIAGLLVDERDFRAAQTVRAEGARLEVDHRHPLADEARILAGADVVAVP